MREPTEQLASWVEGNILYTVRVALQGSLVVAGLVIEELHSTVLTCAHQYRVDRVQHHLGHGTGYTECAPPKERYSTQGVAQPGDQ